MKFLNHNLFTGDITVNGTTTLSTATGVTRPTGDDTIHLATTAFVKAQGYAIASGTTNYLSKFTGTTTLGNSQIFDNGTNVGIGTITPSQKLNIEGNVLLNVGGAVYFRDTTSYINEGSGLNIVSGASRSINFSAGGSERMRITSTGNIGIGTTNPAAKLQVIGTTDVVNIVGAGTTTNKTLLSVDGSFGRLFEVSDDLSDSLFSVNTIAGLPVIEAFADYTVKLGPFTNQVIINNLGNVGLGIASPTEKLHVNGRVRIATVDNGVGDFLTLSATGVVTDRTAAQVLTDIGAQPLLTNPVTGTGTATRLAFWNSASSLSSNANLFWDNTNSRLGIGTTAPGHLFEVNGSDSTEVITAGFYNTSAYGVGTFGRTVINIGKIEAGGRQPMAQLVAGPVSGANSLNGYFTIRTRNAGTLTDRVTIDNQGLVGIGITAPTEALHVVGRIRVTTVDNGTGDFLTLSATGVITDRTATQVLSDIGAQPLLTNPVTGTGTATQVAFWSAANTLTSNSNLYWDNTNSRLGIGTTTPADTLTVVGTFRSTSLWTTSSGVTQWGVSGTAYGTLTWDTGYARIHANTGNRLDLGGNGGLHMSISTTGNVGIGTTAPSRSLHVVSTQWDNTSGGGAIFENNSAVGAGITLKPTSSVVTNGSNGWAVYAGGPSSAIGDGNFGFWAHGTNEARLVIQRGGNVGIGLTSPGVKLDVSGDIRASSTLYASSAVVNSIRMNGATELIFRNTSTTELARLTSTGEFGIGTTSPSQKLHVVGNAYITGAYYDSTNSPGTAGQVLTSTATGTDWKSLSEITGVDGTGTANYLAKWSDTDTITSSVVYDNGTNVGINTSSPAARLDINGNAIVGSGSKANGTWPLYISDSSNLGWKVADSAGVAKFELYAGGSSINQMRLLGGVSLVGHSQDLVLGTSSYLSTITISNTNGNVGIGTTSPSYKLDIQGSNINDSSISVQGALNINVLAAPVAIGGYTLSAGTSLGVGQYYYFVTYVTAVGETSAGGNLSVVTTSGNTTVNLTGIPVSSDPRVTARKLYRTFLNCSSDCHKFLGTISNNTQTTYTDSTPDASLIGGTLQWYKVNTTSRYLTVSGIQGAIIDSNLTAFGRSAGAGIISSSGAAIRTVLIGTSAGQNITTGYANVIVGVAGYNLTTGSNNALFGDLAGSALTTGGDNTIIGGDGAGRFLTTGFRNTIIGVGAARFLADNTTQFTTGSDNIVIGRFAKMFTASDTNSIVIGTGAFGLGSNKTVIGTSSTTDTIIPAGNFGIGTTSPGYRLDVNGDINIVSSSVYRIGGNTILAGTTSVSVGSSGATGSVILRTTSGDGLVLSGANVGIGVTSPSQKLHVSGNVRVTGAYYDSANSAGTSGQILSSTATGTSWINNTVQTAVNNGKITVGSLTGTTEMAPLPVATYDGAVYHYVVKNGANLRAGTINAVWDGTVVSYTEVSTSDIGSTSGVLLSVTISGTDAVLNVTVPASGWSIKVVPIGI